MEIIDEGGHSIRYDKLIARKFNTFYIEDVDELVAKLNDRNGGTKWKNKGILGSMMVERCDEEEMLKILKGIDEKKSKGLDDIQPKVVKFWAEELA